ncbi:MAG: hydroxymethylbilane synthase [Candidatus Pelagibacter sp.]|nr:hydroxymethylbilane synthase [Candidatus Pelagibacter sp.]OUW24356.1 MAG: hydroxymethylbilane synthase [Rickettsiales bacterium TMED174]|tara:strand:- start:842 stop:1762 length:921 start_codon:yes stop_codon:yes gene_type:complete
MNKKIIIGARGSKLSLAYVEKVKKLLKDIYRSDNLKIKVKKIKTSGDLFSKESISKLGGKNNFCKEIEEQLEKKKIDIAIHSLKDMETIQNDNLTVASYLKRNDPKDVLILNKNYSVDIDSSFKIGTSSPRREYQIKNIYKKIITKEIRGNIDSRIKKISTGRYDGIMIAAAGVLALGLEKKISKIFSVNEVIPCGGQGIIALQCRKKDFYIKMLLSKLNDTESEICAKAEKKFLETIGGDCHTAVGVFAEVHGEKLKIISQLFSDDGKHYFTNEKVGKISSPENLGKIAGEETLIKFKKHFKKKK